MNALKFVMIEVSESSGEQAGVRFLDEYLRKRFPEAAIHYQSYSTPLGTCWFVNTAGKTFGILASHHALIRLEALHAAVQMLEAGGFENPPELPQYLRITQDGGLELAVFGSA